MTFNQDQTAQKARQMQGGKRGPVLVDDFNDTSALTLTYNDDGTIDTLVILKTYADGTQWQKTITFSYNGSGNLIGTTTALVQLITGDDVES